MDTSTKRDEGRPKPITRRHYLTLRAMVDTGCHYFTAIEAVASTAIEHPEWDMDEARMWDEWEAMS